MHNENQRSRKGYGTPQGYTEKGGLKRDIPLRGHAQGRGGWLYGGDGVNFDTVTGILVASFVLCLSFIEYAGYTNDSICLAERSEQRGLKFCSHCHFCVCVLLLLFWMLLFVVLHAISVSLKDRGGGGAGVVHGL